MTGRLLSLQLFQWCRRSRSIFTNPRFFTSVAEETKTSEPTIDVESKNQRGVRLPAHEYFPKYAEYLLNMLPRYIEQANLYKDELTIYISPNSLIPVMTFLRDHSNAEFKSLVDISGVDYPGREARFELVYHLLSIRYSARLRVKTYASEVQGVPSLAGIFASANWFEREIWDMYGVRFEGHPDLRRILTDYGFKGHPFRKDFPLTGYVEVRYDEEQKRVVVEPIQMTQEYRRFDLGSPWQQIPKKDPVKSDVKQGEKQ